MYSFSVIVSIYKVEKYLRQCIESILTQTYADFELILVDDGSDDNCPSICDGYAQKDKRVKVIHKVNGGLITTRKTGLSIAGGEYICFVDGDDFIEPNMLETYFNIFSVYKPDIICSGYNRYYEGKKDPDQATQKIAYGLYMKEDLRRSVYSIMLSIPPFFNFYVMPSVCTKCFRKSILQKAYHRLPDNISIGEDVAVSYYALLLADSIFVANYSGYNYRQNLKSMTHSYDSNLYDKIRTLVAYLWSINVHENWEKERQICEYTLYLFLYAVKNEFVYNRKEKYIRKRENILSYLRDDYFTLAFNTAKIKGFKNWAMVCFAKHKFTLPFFAWGAWQGRTKAR